LKIKVNLNRDISFSIDHHQEKVVPINRISVGLDAYVWITYSCNCLKLLMLKKEH
jgi:hypothetical protein